MNRPKKLYFWNLCRASKSSPPFYFRGDYRQSAFCGLHFSAYAFSVVMNPNPKLQKPSTNLRSKMRVVVANYRSRLYIFCGDEPRVTLSNPNYIFCGEELRKVSTDQRSKSESLLHNCRRKNAIWRNQKKGAQFGKTLKWICGVSNFVITSTFHFQIPPFVIRRAVWNNFSELTSGFFAIYK